MGTTNSTSKELNKYLVQNGETLYGDEVRVVTGNQKDSEGKVKSGKYTSGKIKNMTYTLETNKGSVEETGRLLNYYDAVWDGEKNVYVYGHPDKWVFDANQKYNNCGVVSALNILSTAGKISAIAPTESEIEEWKAKSKTKTVTTIDPDTNETVTKTVTVYPYKNADYTSSEELLTLYAMQHHYCNGSYDASSYTSVKNLKEEDGGTYFVNLNKEKHLYHDSMKDINAILADYGVKSNTYTLSMYLQCDSSYDADEEKELTEEEKESTTVTDPTTGQTTEIEQETNDVWTVYKDKSEYNGKMNLVINSTDGSDTLHFADLNLSDIQKEYYTFVRKGTSLVINYNETNYVEIQNVYDVDDPEQYTHIRKITFGSGDNYEEYTLSQLAHGNYNVDILNGGYRGYYEEEALNTPTRQYGYFVRTLASLVVQGKGIILQGAATQSFAKSGSAMDPNHAITLTGVTYKYYDTNTDDRDKSIYDIDGFYVVDSGGWLNKDATGAEWISCEQLYNFLSGSLFLNKGNVSKYGYAGESRRAYAAFIMTDDCIKDWADDLNMVGNAKRNILFGNDGDNILKGGNSTDNLYGGKGDDKLYGGSGNDWLYGEEGTNYLYGGSGNDTYVVQDIERAPIYRTDVNGDYILYKVDEDGEFVLDGNGNKIVDNKNGVKELIGYEKQEIHDIVIPGAGKDYLRFENLKDKSDLQYFNNNGDLEIRYDYYLLDKDTEKYGYNTLTVKDYFKKGLYSNIAWLDDANTIEQRLKDDRNHAYKFLSIISSSEIGYDIDPTVKNNISGTKFNDEIVSGNRDDVISAGAGNDTITPGAGDNTIRAGAGNDTINLGYGNNKVYLDSGKNKIVYDKDGTISGYDTIYSGKGTDIIEMQSKSADDLFFSRKGNNLVIYYDNPNNNGTGSSITIMNYFKNPAKCSVKEIRTFNEYQEDEFGNLLKNGNVYEEYTGDFYKKNGDTYEIMANGKYIKNEDGSYTEVTRYSIKWDIVSLANGVANLVNNLDKKGGLDSGLGNDILSGANGGNNVFKFHKLYDGVDTIKTQKTGSITVDLSETGITRNGDIGFNNGLERYNFGEKNYAYSKSGNDLIINYGLELKNESMSRIILQNYFKSPKLSYTLKAANDAEEGYDLKNALIYFEGQQKSKNKITGSSQNDLIYGGELADTIKAGAGDDVIYSGKGNDAITGGSGTNEIHYEFGDGANTITLSKNENLSFFLKSNEDGEFAPENIEYAFDKKGNLLITYEDETILTVKNFKKKDATGTNGSIQLFVDDALILNFKDDIFVSRYESFTKKKYSYTGKYYSEYIDASNMTTAVNKKNKGVTVKAGGGDDIIIGSDYNDTLKGQAGNDLIIAANGKNSVDGGSGDDTYYLFYDDSLTDSNEMKQGGKQSHDEHTTIKDTGLAADKTDAENNVIQKADNDTAFIFEENKNINLWFNIDDKGNVITNKDKKGKDLGTVSYYIETSDGKNSATVTGVENFVDKNGKLYAADDVVEAVKTWLEGRYTSVAEAMKKATSDEIEQLYKRFKIGWSGEYEGHLYNEFASDNYIYSGKWYSETIDASGLEEQTKIGGVSVNGGGGNDTIVGSKFDDKLRGGTGNDTFVFKDNTNGNDTIVDGENGDVLKFESAASNLSFENKDGKLVITHHNSINANESTILINNFDFNATKESGENYNIETEIITEEDTSESFVITYKTKEEVIENGEKVIKEVEKQRKITNFDILDNGDRLEAQRLYRQIALALTTTNINDIMLHNGEKIAILDQDINVILEHNKKFEATAYNEIITGVGSVTGFSNLFDKVKMNNVNNITYSRTNHEGLVISDDAGNKITITDFDFSSKYSNNAIITDGVHQDITTQNMTLEVSLEDGFKYNATPYNEIITVDGSATINNIDNLSHNDIIKINEHTTPRFSRNDENLIVRYVNSDEETETITIRNFDFYGSPDDNYNTLQVKKQNSAQYDNYLIGAQEITYQMTGGTYDSNEYADDGTTIAATNQYKELYNGSGTLKNFDYTNDRIRFAGTAKYSDTSALVNSNTAPVFSRTSDSNDLVATYTENKYSTNLKKDVDTKHTITVADFFKGNNNINYLEGYSEEQKSTADMELNVTLNGKYLSEDEDKQFYTATNYKEVVTGNGNIKGLSSNTDGEGHPVENSDTIKITLDEGEEIEFSRENNGGLIISSAANKINVLDFFTQENPNYDINVTDTDGNEMSTSDMVLNVTIGSDSSQSATTVYQATKYQEIITGKGKVTNLDTDDLIRIVSDDATKIEYAITNDKTLKINDTVEVEAFLDSDGFNVQLNDGESIAIPIINLDDYEQEYNENPDINKIFHGIGTINSSALGNDVIIFNDKNMKYKYDLGNETLNITNSSDEEAINISNYNSDNYDVLDNIKIYEFEREGEEENKLVDLKKEKTLTITNANKFDASAITSFKGVVINNNVAANCIYIGTNNEEDKIATGSGSDILVGGEGKNILEGRGGNDTYYLFYKGAAIQGNNVNISNTTKTTNENTTINESNNSGNDVVIINGNKTDDDLIVTINYSFTRGDGETPNMLNELDEFYTYDVILGSNTATISNNVEKIYDNGNGEDRFVFNFDGHKAAIETALTSWFESNGSYSSVSAVLNGESQEHKDRIVEIFNQCWENQP